MKHVYYVTSNPPANSSHLACLPSIASRSAAHGSLVDSFITYVVMLSILGQPLDTETALCDTHFLVVSNNLPIWAGVKECRLGL